MAELDVSVEFGFALTGILYKLRGGVGIPFGNLST